LLTEKIIALEDGKINWFMVIVVQINKKYVEIQNNMDKNYKIY